MTKYEHNEFLDLVVKAAQKALHKRDYRPMMQTRVTPVPMRDAIFMTLLKSSQQLADHGKNEWLLYTPSFLGQLVSAAGFASAEDHWNSSSNMVEDCASRVVGGHDIDFEISRILPNRAMCLECGEIVESKHRHDFQSCSCDNIFVDGGFEYSRRGFRSAATFRPLDWDDSAIGFDEPEQSVYFDLPVPR